MIDLWLNVMLVQMTLFQVVADFDVLRPESVQLVEVDDLYLVEDEKQVEGVGV